MSLKLDFKVCFSNPILKLRSYGDCKAPLQVEKKSYALLSILQ